jgi:hypothetical protein
MALLAAEALGLGDGDAADTPTSCSASFTSSSLNGLMIASIFFTLLVPLWAGRRPLRIEPDQLGWPGSPSSRCGVPPSCTNQKPCQLANRGVLVRNLKRNEAAAQGVGNGFIWVPKL